MSKLKFGLNSTTSLCCALSLALSPLPAVAVQQTAPQCGGVLAAKSLRTSTLAYLKDIKATYGLRLILRQRVPLELRRGGLLEESDVQNQGVLDRIHYLIWKAPLTTQIGKQRWFLSEQESSGKYELAPLGFVREQLLNRPVRFAAQKLQRNLEPSNWLHFAFDSLLLASIYSYYDSSLQQKEALDLRQQRRDQDQTLTTLINYDRRYQSIKTAIENRVITPKQGGDAALVLSQILSDYYEEAYQASDHRSDEDLLQLTMFTDILNLQKGGISLDDRYRTLSGFTKSLSKEQLHMLIQNRKALLLDYDLVAAEILNNRHTKAKVILQMIDNLKKDSFYQYLLDLKLKNLISDLQMIQYAQENLYWQHRLLDYQILQIERLQEDIDQPVTLEIFQKEMKEELDKTTQQTRRTL